MSKRFLKGNERRGLALVMVMALMALLMILLVALLGLTGADRGASTQSRYQLEAQSNAKLALMQALGELQQHAGPDRRVTAGSKILDPNVQNQHMLGVWHSWGEGLEDGTNVDAASVATTYADQRRGDRFQRWLAPEVDAAAAKTRDLEFPNAAMGTDAVQLLGEGTLGAGAPQQLMVDMPVVPIVDSGERTGSFSWWIDEEGTKARVNLYQAQPTASSDKVLERAVAPMLSAGEISGYEKLDAEEASKKGVTRGSLDFLATGGALLPDVAKQRYHDVSIHSKGLLTNTKWGGPKKDLNLMLELATMPTDYANRELFADGPGYAELREYYRGYKPFSEGGRVKWIAGVPHFNPGETWSQVVSRSDWARNLPVPVKWQWLLSHYSHRFKDSSGETKYQVRLVFDDIVELWNPMNLPMVMPTDSVYALKTFNMPYGVKYQVNGTNWQHSIGGGDASKALFWVLKDQMGEWYAESGVGTTNINWGDGSLDNTLKAGEVRVLSSGNLGPRPADKPIPMHAGWEIAGGRYSADLGHGAQHLEVSGGTRIGVELAQLQTDIYIRPGQPMDHLIERYFFGAGKAYHGHVRTYGMRDDVAPAIEYAEESEFTAGEVENIEGKKPFAMIGFRMRTEQRVAPAVDSPISGSEKKKSKHLRLSDLWEPYLNIESNQIGLRHQAYEFFAQRVDDFSNIPLVEISPSDYGYTGTSRISGEGGGSAGDLPGQNFVPIREVPFQPLVSMAQLQGSSLGAPNVKPGSQGGDQVWLYECYPYVANAVGNGYALPYIPADKLDHQGPTPSAGTVELLHDKSWKLNDALWDDWFFSSVAPQEHELISSADRRPMRDVLEQGVKGTGALPNHRYEFDPIAVGGGGDDLVNELWSPDGYRKIAASMVCEGAFNVNSTSVEAWKAFLASLDGRELAWLDPETGVLNDGAARYPVSRFTLPLNEPAVTGEFSSNQQEFLSHRWGGVRSLTEGEIDELAKAMVEQVRERGPFLSLGEFVNRRLARGDSGLKGALQAAIDNTSINESFNQSSETIGDSEIADAGYQNAAAAKGLVGEGAPGYVTQADILMPLAPLARVRSDTFVIRTYGDSRGSNGDVRARAYCEVVVQRTHNYVDVRDEYDEEIVDASGAPTLSLEEVNRRFGRKFKVVSFRWLSEDEV